MNISFREKNTCGDIGPGKKFGLQAKMRIGSKAKPGTDLVSMNTVVVELPRTGRLSA